MSKVVLITGASSGLGFAIADYLSQKGFVVYGSNRKPDTEITYSFKMLPLELTNKDTIKKAVDLIIKEEGRLDILINNAGTGITGPLEETPTEEIKKSFDINLFGLIDVTKTVLPHMRKQQSGLIINITSIAGYMGLPYRGVYSSLKAAARILTESMSMEVKNFGIHVVNLAPGDFKTNIASRRYHSPVKETSVYKEVYLRNLDLMNTHVSDGENPIEIAKDIYKIINTKKPKTHYRSGKLMQKVSITLKWILPSKVYERVLMRYYKL
ncbi:MAG: SDR family oxidoreductase [Urechidicola sp.]|nr:SDR family oxidoreductase [Urechidicola sp.]